MITKPEPKKIMNEGETNNELESNENQESKNNTRF